MNCPDDCPHPSHQAKEGHGFYLVIILLAAALIGILVSNG